MSPLPEEYASETVRDSVAKNPGCEVTKTPDGRGIVVKNCSSHDVFRALKKAQKRVKTSRSATGEL